MNMRPNRIVVAEAPASARSTRSSTTTRTPSAISAGDSRARPARIRRRLGHPRARDEGGRDQERQRVDEQGERRGHEADQQAAHARSHDLRRRRRRLELGVALDDPIGRDQRGEQRHVRHVEEHRERAGEEQHRVEDLDAEDANHRGQRNDQQQDGATEVGRDHHRPSPHPIHPHAGEETDEQDGRASRRREQPHLPGRGVEGQRGDQRDRERSDLGPDVGDRRARPELHELPVPPQRGHDQRLYQQRVASVDNIMFSDMAPDACLGTARIIPLPPRPILLSHRLLGGRPRGKLGWSTEEPGSITLQLSAV